MSEWIKCSDKYPHAGEAILIVVNGIVQDVTFKYDYLCGVDEWFAPYFFDDVSDISIPFNDVSHWMPLPEPPK